MGGPGSGNWFQSGRNTVEACHAIDVCVWNREGYIPGPGWFTTNWYRNGEKTGSIGVRTVGHDAVHLTFRTRSYGAEEWEDIEQSVPLDWTDCNFGGQRPWFRCSIHANGVYCGRRVSKLYAGVRLFACRHCYNLAYQSQHEPPHGRALLKTQKIRMKLGGSPSLTEPFPHKPKGMHWKSYERLCIEAGEAEIASWTGLERRFGMSF